MGITSGYGRLASKITTDPKLSLWHTEGMTVPLDLQSFHEQSLNNGIVVVVIRFRPKKVSRDLPNDTSDTAK